MKFAIVGADATTFLLAKAAARRSDVQIEWFCDEVQAADRDIAVAQRAAAPQAQGLDAWDDLLDPGMVDGVIVARGIDDDRTSEQLRKFAQLGIPVLFSHPAVDSMLLYYELDMIRQDTQALIVPALAERLHPAIRELHALVEGQSPSLGAIEHVAIERPLGVRNKYAVRAQFARDVDLLRWLCGELNQIGALGAANEDAAYANLSIQMIGPNQLPARWSTHAPESGECPCGRVVFTGSNGRTSLEMPDGEPWVLKSSLSGERLEYADWDPGQTLLSDFVRRLKLQSPEPGAADLMDAARAAELTETIDRSLARRRTIDLHYEERSEANTFKGKMAVGGCLLLMLGLLSLPVLAILARANVPGIWLWPWLLAGIFGVFTLLQLLTFVFKK